jgi:hypothetical protein
MHTLMVLAASAPPPAPTGDISTAALLTFGLPLGVFVIAIGFCFHQRKPYSSRHRSPLFPQSGLPQAAYDQQLVAAMSEKAQQALVAHSQEGDAGAERPLGGR